MWATTTNPYLDTNWLDDQFTQAMKAQERTAILAILAAQRSQISAAGTDLSQKLTQKSAAMKDFAANRLTSRLTEGLEGKGADAADDYLKNKLKKPAFKSPVKGA